MKRFIAIIGILLLSSIAIANDNNVKSNIIKGFRNMTWEMTPENAKTVYPDFEFGYKSTKGAIYKRSAEDFKIAETNFDEIRYNFTDDKFTKVIAIIEIDSMSRRSSGESEYIDKSPQINFENIKKKLESNYGVPTHYKEDTGKRQRGIDPLYMTQKKAEWLIGDSRLILELMTGTTMAFLDKNKGSKGKNDVLVFSIEYVPSGKLGF